MPDKNVQNGFTLVELAVVMIVIGVLIAGILKGAEMVRNAEISATISQIKDIETAAYGFQDKYQEFPGDMNNTQNRISGIAAGQDGDDSGRLNHNIGTAAGGEAIFFWTQLIAADLLGGEINGSTLESEIDNVFISNGYWAGGAAPGNGLGNNYVAGHYLALSADTDSSMNEAALLADQLGRIDRKMDDGDPLSGTVHGSEANAGDCAAGNAYNEDNGALACGAYIRFLN